jgi:hypothetical protein
MGTGRGGVCVGGLVIGSVMLFLFLKVGGSKTPFGPGLSDFCVFRTRSQVIGIHKGKWLVDYRKDALSSAH